MADVVAEHETHAAGSKLLIPSHDFPDLGLVEFWPSDRQPMSRDGREDARFLLGRKVGVPLAEAGGGDHAERHGLAVQPAPVAPRGLDRMAYGVTEIQQGPNVFSLELVLLDDARLDLATAPDDGGPFRGTARGDLIEQRGIADDPILDDLGDTRAQFAIIEGGEGGRVDDDQGRLVESTDEILALREVDGGLAADGTVHHGEERRGDLRVGHAAHEQCGKKAGGIADGATPKREHRRSAVEAGAGHIGEGGFQRREGLGRLAVWNEDGMRIKARVSQGCDQRIEIVAGDGLRRDHRGLAGDDLFGSQAAGLPKQSVRNEDGIGSWPKFDIDALHAVMQHESGAGAQAESEHESPNWARAPCRPPLRSRRRWRMIGAQGMKDSPLALCFGEVLWDILPEGRFAGGAPFNVGYHLSRLGWRAMPVSSVGSDALGAELLALLRGWGVNTGGVAVLSGVPTGTVAVELDGEGKPRFEIRRNVAWDAVPVSDDVIAAAGAADALVFGSLSQRSMANRQALGLLLATARSALKVFDVNLRPPFDDAGVVRGLLGKADIIKLNDEELDRLAGCGRGGRDIERGAREIGDVAGGKAVCVTCGAQGAGLLWEDQWHWEATRPVKVADTVGSGDAFLAALMAGLHLGWSPVGALAGACRLGEWVAARRGATPAYRATATTRENWSFEEIAG